MRKSDMADGKPVLRGRLATGKPVNSGEIQKIGLLLSIGIVPTTEMTTTLCQSNAVGGRVMSRATGVVMGWALGPTFHV